MSLPHNISPELQAVVQFLDERNMLNTRLLLEEIDRLKAQVAKLQPEADMSVQEVAGLLNVSDQTVINMCLDGRIDKAYKSGSLWRIPRQSVEKLRRPFMEPDLSSGRKQTR